jgi:hypothetical protein
MPVDVAWEDRGVVVAFGGSVPMDLILDHCRRLEGDSRFDHLLYSIVDLRSLVHAPVSDRELKELAAENWASCLSNLRLTTFVIAEDPALVSVLNKYLDVMPDAHGVAKPMICSSPEQAREALVLAAPYPSGAGI